MISCKLKDVCKLVKGKQIDTTQLAENLPFKYINGGVKESGYYEKYNTNGNTIIISEGGASCGYVSYITEKFWLGCHCYKLIDVSVDSKYLFYALKANQQRIMELRTGAAMPNIKKTILNELQIKISMDEAEQKQAVKNLDYIEHLLEIENTALLSLDELTKSRFMEMFGDFSSNPFGWPICRIGDVVTDVRYGTSIPASDDGQYPYLRMNNITYEGELDVSDLKRINVPLKDLDKYSVQKGDVLFNRTNSWDKVGKTCVYNLDETMVLAGFVIRVRVARCILPEFLSAFLNTKTSKVMLTQICKRAIGQANINAEDLKNISLYLPPIEIQEAFVSFKAQIDKSKLVIKKTIAELEELKSSLMQKYFFD